MATADTHVYLSPHLDDAVLSCGATIHRQARAGERVLVVTIFAGSADRGADTPFTRELRDRWGADADPVAMRRAEDLEAMRCIGAGAMHVAYPDCVYRLGSAEVPLYPTVEHIFADVHPEEAEFYLAVTDSVRDCLREAGLAADQAILYTPLTAGHHVDHLITACAARALRQEGWQLACYEDYPYAVAEEPLARARAAWQDLGLWQQVRYCDRVDLEGKIDGIACYRSQISTFWQSLAEMADAIEQYARQVGGDSLAEAFWHVGTL